MPRHPEVLTDINDEVVQFERCAHSVHQSLVLEPGVELRLRQPAFGVVDAKNQPQVVEHRQGQIRELAGEERDAAIKRLARDAKTESTLVAHVEDRDISLSGASVSLALYRHRESGELWVGKSDVLDGGALSAEAVLKERVANDIYAYYGVPVPRLAVATLPCCYRTADNQRILGEEEGIVRASHLMSRWLDRFNSYPGMPNFAAPVAGEAVPEFRLVVDDQWLPERGLGHVLAVAHFIHDVDVTNAAGKNIGYRLQVDAAGQLYAQTCKIDPGYAFHDLGERRSPAYRVTRAMPFKTQHREQDYIPFDYFPRATQLEFIATLADIVATPVADLSRFFNRAGRALAREDFSKRAAEMLAIRQAGLKTVFAAELAALRVEAKESKESKAASGALDKLPDELRPIYAKVLLEQGNPIFQQAQHFYIEPGITDDNQKESKQQPFNQMVDGFLRHEQARVLLLLGDSGFGKSTATQRITQQQWQGYSQEPRHHRIAIRIELKQFTARTVNHCVENVLLDDYHLTPAQIVALKQRPCLLILDGFDEIGGREKCNLWDSNGLGTWRDVRLVITCRSTYLAYEDIAHYFYPAGQMQGLQQRYLAPFGLIQIQTYLEKALTPLEKVLVPVLPPPSKISRISVGDIKESKLAASMHPVVLQLTQSHQLQELLQVPLLLKIFIDALPGLQRQNQELQQLNRYVLYEAFMTQWFERNRARLSQNLGQTISPEQCQAFLSYSQDLAFELFKAQTVKVNYAPGQAPWDQFFSNSDEDTIRLRSGCPLRRANQQYSFIHKSFYEFFLAQRLVQLANARGDDLIPLIERLRVRSLVTEPQVLVFMRQAYQGQKLSQLGLNKFFALIRRSAEEPAIAQASANAATILNHCRVQLTRQQWQRVQLPGADLSYGILAYSDLSRANLRGATLMRVMLYQACFEEADLREVEWGERPWLELRESVGAIAYHPTRPLLAVAQGKTIVLIDTNTGERIGQVLAGHDGVVTSMAFSPDGRRLASGGGDKTVRLWDVEKQVALGEPLVGHTRWVTSMAFSPDGHHLASGSDDCTVRLWDVKKQVVLGKPLVGHVNLVNSVAFGPDGCCLASGSDDCTVRLWDVKKQVLLGEPLTGHAKLVSSVAFSPDGCCLASGSDDCTVRLWDVKKQVALGKPLAGHAKLVNSVAFSPDGRCLASGSTDSTVRLWDVEKQVLLGEPLTGHAKLVNSVAFSPDGRYLASGSSDCTVRFWDVEKQIALGELLVGHMSHVQSVSFSPDGRRLASGGGDKSVRLWDVEKQVALGEPLAGHAKLVSVSFSPDGRRLASGGDDSTVRLWDVEKQVVLGEFLLVEHQQHRGVRVASVAFSPDGRRLASGSLGYMLRGCPGTLAPMYRPGSVRLWDVEKQVALGELQARYDASSVAFSPDARRLASGSNNHETVQLWDVEKQVMLGKPLAGHKGGVRSVAFSSDGCHLASGSNNKIVRLWDVEKQVVLGDLAGHSESVSSLAFSSDGRHLASGSEDHTVRLWEVNSGRCLTVSHWQYAINSIAIIRSPFLTSNSAEAKSSRSLKASVDQEDCLAIGDAGGMVSFWAISPKDGGLRFVGMPPQPHMLLYLKGARFRGCQLDKTAQRLLKQYGADEREFMYDVVEAKRALPDVKEDKRPAIAQAAAGQGFLPAPNLPRHAQTLMTSMMAELKRHPKQEWGKNAAATFTATVLGALRKKKFNELLHDPEIYDLPTCVVPVVREYVKQQPELPAMVSSNLVACKQLEVQLLKEGQVLSSVPAQAIASAPR